MVAPVVSGTTQWCRTRMPLLVHRAVAAAHSQAPRHSDCLAQVLLVEDSRAVLQLDQTMAMRRPVAVVVAPAVLVKPQPHRRAVTAALVYGAQSQDPLRHMVAVEVVANDPQVALVRVTAVADLAGLTRRAQQALRIEVAVVVGLVTAPVLV